MKKMSTTTKCIAFVHHKGGTGKTTSCLNIAGWLVKMNNKVLIVDLDPQGNATAGLAIDRKTIDGSLYEALFGQKKIEEIILETDSGVFLAPSSSHLLASEMRVAGQINSTRILKEALSNVKKHFDYILVDVPPGSPLLMINGIVAAENIIIPLDSGVFAYETMEILKEILIDLNKEIGVKTNLIMVLLREYSTSLFENGPTREIKKMLRAFLSENNIPGVKIFIIPFSTKVYKAQMRGTPISHHAPHCDVGRAYKKITKEIMKYEL